MKIHEVIIESQQDIDEISLRGVGQAISKGAKAVGKGIGGIAGGTVGAAKQFGQGVKQGWEQGISTTTGSGQTSSPAQTRPAGSSAKSLNKNSLKKIKDLIVNLNPQQKQYLLTALANKTNQPQAPAAKPTTMATTPVSKRNVPKPTNPNLKQSPATPAGAFGQMASSLTKP